MSQDRRTIADWRKVRDQMTQQQLAMRTGLSMSAIANIEARRQDVTMLTAERIAAALGVTVGDILWPSAEEIEAARAKRRSRGGKEAA